MFPVQTEDQQEKHARWPVLPVQNVSRFANSEQLRLRIIWLILMLLNALSAENAWLYVLQIQL
jgi:hypothetical protein